jgi:hypothetical protein
MPIDLMNMKFHVKIVDGGRFKVGKVSDGPVSILALDDMKWTLRLGSTI